MTGPIQPNLKAILFGLSGMTVILLFTAAAAGIWMIWNETVTDGAGRALSAAIIGCAVAAVCLAQAWVFAQNRLRPWMALGAACAVVAGLIWLIFIIVDAPRMYPAALDRVAVVGVALTAMAGALAYTGLMSLLPARWTSVRLAIGAAIWSAWILGGAVVLLVAIDALGWRGIAASPVYDLLAVAAGAGGLVAALLAVAVPMSCRIAARRDARPRESVSSRIFLHMTCPECGEPQQFRSGPVRCARCRFLMEIEIEEPRCECGYLLFQLTGETCPECGRAIEGRAAGRPRVVNPSSNQTPSEYEPH